MDEQPLFGAGSKASKRSQNQAQFLRPAPTTNGLLTPAGRAVHSGAAIPDSPVNGTKTMRRRQPQVPLANTVQSPQPQVAPQETLQAAQPPQAPLTIQQQAQPAVQIPTQQVPQQQVPQQQIPQQQVPVHPASVQPPPIQQAPVQQPPVQPVAVQMPPQPAAAQLPQAQSPQPVMQYQTVAQQPVAQQSVAQQPLAAPPQQAAPLQQIQPQTGSEEDRRENRKRALKGGMIILPGQMMSSFACKIRNESRGGVMLVLPDATRVPAEFYLIREADPGHKIPCRVAWREPERLGIEFVTALQAP